MSGGETEGTNRGETEGTNRGETEGTKKTEAVDEVTEVEDPDICDGIRDHLKAALDSTTDSDGRFHIRQALQLVDVSERTHGE